MGTGFFDTYSLLHFAMGIIIFYFNISFTNSILLHILYEFIENTNYGMYLINKYTKDICPGKKEYKDYFINNIGDTVFFGEGWIFAYYFRRTLSDHKISKRQLNKYYSFHLLPQTVHDIKDVIGSSPPLVCN